MRVDSRTKTDTMDALTSEKRKRLSIIYIRSVYDFFRCLELLLPLKIYIYFNVICQFAKLAAFSLHLCFDR